MPPRLFMPVEDLDLAAVVADREQIREFVPQRHEMEQISVVHYLTPDKQIAAASRPIRDDEFWVRGHIPGRPIFPGVLMVESAAQLITWHFKQVVQDDRFLGFAGLTDVRFRGAVVPGDLLVLLSRVKEIRSRRSIFDAQGVVAGRLVFEGTIQGMAV